MKRTRFTVTLDSGEKRVILAYTATEVARLVGVDLSRVQRGDYRKAAQHPTGARPVMSAVREAADFLGITLPIYVEVTNHRGATMGKHNAIPTGGGSYVKGRRIYNLDHATGWKHRIVVKGWLTAEQMGQTLWHELAHAMQFERDILPRNLTPRQANLAWNTAYRDGTTYRNKPYEVEARSYELHNSELPLAR